MNGAFIKPREQGLNLVVLYLNSVVPTAWTTVVVLVVSLYCHAPLTIIPCQTQRYTILNLAPFLSTALL